MREIRAEHQLPLERIHWQRDIRECPGVLEMWILIGLVVAIMYTSCQNSSHCTLKICACMVCNFALILKNLKNTSFLFLVHWQVKEESQKMYTVERLRNSFLHVTTSFHRFLEVLPSSRVDRHYSLSLLLVYFLIWFHSDLGAHNLLLWSNAQVMKAGVSPSQD